MPKKAPKKVTLNQAKFCSETVNTNINQIYTKVNTLLVRVQNLETQMGTLASNQWDQIQSAQEKLNSTLKECSEVLSTLRGQYNGGAASSGDGVVEN